MPVNLIVDNFMKYVQALSQCGMNYNLMNEEQIALTSWLTAGYIDLVSIIGMAPLVHISSPQAVCFANAILPGV